jgi:hypothetical protein
MSTQPRVFLWIGLIVLLFIDSISSLPDEPNSLLQMLFLIVVAIILFGFWFVSFVFTRLIISRDGIEYRSVFCRVKLIWGEIERIEIRGKRWFVICRSSEIASIPVVIGWLKFFKVDKIIDLNRFTSSFLESEIAKAIFHHAKQINIVSTT